MNFIDKLQVLKEFDDTYFSEKGIYFINIPHSGCPGSYIESLKKAYPQIANDYVTFLSSFDGLELNDIRFLGSNLSPYGDIMGTASWFTEELPGSIPIAHDSAGDIFYIHRDGKIYWIMIDNLGEETYAELIAENFVDFINEVCLGERYVERYGRNEWYQFIKSQGWAE